MLPARIASAKMLTAMMRWVIVQRRDQRTSRSPSSFFGKAISDAVEGFDGLELSIDGAELAAEPLDVAVDGPIVDIDIVLIGDVHQLVARFHHAGTLRQCLQ